MTYYKLTDTINKDVVVRVQGGMAEAYNAAFDVWEIFPDWLRYRYPGDVFEDLYEEIPESAVESVMLSYRKRWKAYWDFAQRLVATKYKQLRSPIKGMNYESYAYIIVELAENERERVMYALSGLTLLPDWEKLATAAHLTKPIMEGLKQWHTGTKQLWRISNQWVLRMVLTELNFLVTRQDLVDSDKVYSRLNTLKLGFTPEQIYSEVL